MVLNFLGNIINQIYCMAYLIMFTPVKEMKTCKNVLSWNQWDNENTFTLTTYLKINNQDQAIEENEPKLINQLFLNIIDQSFASLLTG